jgi:signal transduction histidine kinase
MNDLAQNYIAMCDWSVSRFLIFSDNVFGTLIYYSHFLALILALVVGLFVFLKDPKSLVNRLLLYIMVGFSFWAFLDLVLWANEKPELIMFFWSLILLVEPLIYALSVYFVYVFITKKDVSLKKKIKIFSLLLPVIVFLPTQFSLVSFDLTNCYREPSEGFIATYYIYFIEIVYVFWIIFFAFKKYLTATKPVRGQIVLLTVGVILFLLSFISGNIIGSFTENWTLAQVGLFSLPIFVIFLAYMVLRFKSFNVKAFGAQLLVFTLGFSVFGMIFIRSIDNVRIVAIVTLVLIIFVGNLLIRGVRKEIEQKEQMVKLNTDLKNLIQQRESLVHLITHKVKGSFTRTKYVFAEMLNDTFGVLTPEMRKMAQTGLESDDTGIKTIDLVLNASNLQSGTVKYQMKNIDLKDMVEKMINELKISAETKNLKINTDMEQGPFTINGDEFWLKEVIHNFIENSIKYTPSNGEIKVGLENKNDKIVFSVTDNGIGLTPDDMAHLFTEGGRGKDSTKMNIDSTGYGLYSAKLIVEAHQGRVWAESAGKDKGSTFFAEFKAL